MRHYFRNHPPQRRWVLALALGSIPGILWIASRPDHREWITLAAVPAVLGFLWLGKILGHGVWGLTLLIFFADGLAQDDPGWRRVVWFHLPALLASWPILHLYRKREEEREREHQSAQATLREKVTLLLEQYKTDLAINLTNQRKMQKYFHLNRISRIFGSQLSLPKLGEVVVRELREVLGDEQSQHWMAYAPEEGQLPWIQSLPEELAIADRVEDDYYAWVHQHRKPLVVPNTLDDFRFKASPAGRPLRSLMLAPLLAQGQMQGWIRVEGNKPNQYTPDDLRFFSLVADLAGVAAENAALYQRAQSLAITDGLTGLYLRRYFNQRLEGELNRSQEDGTPVTLIILDIDHFKNVNDQFGHLAGDQVLIQVAKILKREIRVVDLACRFGGEEFALILPNTNLYGSRILAERIRTRVAETVFWIQQKPVQVTVSLGLGECPVHGATLKALIQSTDEALYTAKRLGRNRIVKAGEGGA